MTGTQITLIAAAFIILLGVSVAAQFRWLPSGRAYGVIVFLAGCATILSLRIANLPPTWFNASKTGFGFAALFIVASFAGRTREEELFRLPLLMGMGLTLLGANLAALV